MSEEEKKVTEEAKAEESKVEETKAPAEEAKTEEAPAAEAQEPSLQDEAKQSSEDAKAETAEEKKESVEEEAKPEAKKEEAKTEKKKEVVADGTPRAPSKESREEAAEQRKKKGPRGDGKKKHGKRRRHEDQEQSEFTEKVVQVRRVTKVVKGGKKLSFRVSVIIGNEKGKVGVGVGKASEVLTAIKKAISDAKKSLVDISTVGSTISHPVRGIAGGSNVLLKPAAEGTGIIAGGTARIVLELAGVGDILAKSQGSKSALNVARATVNALGQLRSFQEVANLRGISMKEMLF